MINNREGIIKVNYLKATHVAVVLACQPLNRRDWVDAATSIVSIATWGA